MIKIKLPIFFISLIFTTTVFSQGMPDIIWTIQANSSLINAVSVSADGSKILSSDNNQAKTWDRETHTLLNIYENSTTLISSTISPDGNYFTVGYIEGIYPDPNLGQSSVINAKTNSTLYNVGGCFTSFSEDNSIIAATGGGVYRNINVHYTISGSTVFDIYNGGYPNDVAVDPSGTFVAVASSNNDVKLYDSQTGTLLQTLVGHTNDVRAVAFSPDGSIIASGAGGWDGTGDATIKIWDVSTGVLITTLEGHGYWTSDVAFSSDGSYLISSGRDGLSPINPKIKIWRTSDWQLQTYYSEGLANGVPSLCAVPGTDLFVFGNSYGELTLAQLPVVIPVELISFTASVSENSVTLRWQTASETNNSGFEVEREQRSETGDQGSEVSPLEARSRLMTEEQRSEGWEKIEFIRGNGTTSETHIYQFIDKNLTAGEYLYRLKQTDFDGSYHYSDIVEVEVISPASFFLKQNFPNPFNPSTEIRYGITEDGFVSLKVFNALGQVIAEPLNGFIRAGNHKIIFDASGLASGIYFYQMSVTPGGGQATPKGGQAKTFIETRKMVLTK